MLRKGQRLLSRCSVLLVFSISAYCLAQKNSVTQQANNVQCGNVNVKDNGTVNLSCSGLTKAQAKLLQTTIPGMLEKLLTADADQFAAVSGELAKLHHSSFEKVDRFTTTIPFLISDNAAEIPLDDNRNDPLGHTYAALRGVASFPRDESRGAPRVDSVKMPGEEIQVFLARVLQYYVVRSIFEIQDPTATWSFNDVDGLTTDAPAPVYVPDQEGYPRDKWLGQAQSLGLNYSRYNERTLPLVSLPRGAILSLLVEDTGGKSPTRYVVRVDRRPDFSLSFILTPTMSGARTLPRNFMIEPRFYRGDIETYTYNFIVDFDFIWNGDRDKGERYQEWALGLVSGMKKRLATSRHDQP
jgi:hypothetical protein